MSKNNHVILTGNIGSEVKTIEKPDLLFAAFSMATKEAYKDDQDKWQETPPTWHRILVFDQDVIKIAKDFKKGERVEVSGSLSYRPIENQSSNQPFKRMEASIIASQITAKPLPNNG